MILRPKFATIKAVESREIGPILYRTGKSGQQEAGWSAKADIRQIGGLVRATVTMRVAPPETTKRLGIPMQHREGNPPRCNLKINSLAGASPRVEVRALERLFP